MIKYGLLDKIFSDDNEKLYEHNPIDDNIFIQNIANGSVKLPSCSSPVVLKRNGEAYISIPNVILNEPRAVRESQSYGLGSSYRVAKGFSVHSGVSHGRSVSHDEIMAIDNGTFVLTNKRIVFLGSKKSTNIDLKKVLALNAFNDGISIQRENKQKTEHFTGVNNKFKWMNNTTGEVFLILDSYFLRVVILGLIAKLE